MSASARGEPNPREAFLRFSAEVRPVYTSLASEVRYEAGEYIGLDRPTFPDFCRLVRETENEREVHLEH